MVSDLKEAGLLFDTLKKGWTEEKPDSTIDSRQHLNAELIVNDTALTPAYLFRECAGIAVFFEFKAAFVVGAHVARGFVVSKLRKDGKNTWSAPMPFVLGGGDFGLVFGANRTCVLVFLDSESDVEKFKSPSVSLGGDVSLSVGPYGRDSRVNLSVGKNGLGANYAYNFSQGLYAGSGVTLQGDVRHGKILQDAYGPDATAEAIITGQKGMEIKSEEGFKEFYDKLDEMVRS